MPHDMKDTLYPDWTPPKYPAWIKKVAKSQGWVFHQGAHMVPSQLAQAQADNLRQLEPFILLHRENPAQLRKRYGKTNWRLVHKASLTTNVHRCLLLLVMPNIDVQKLFAFKPCHLKSFCNLNIVLGREASSYAAINADKGSFSTIAHLYRDTVIMGGHVNDQWSVKRLREEHDKLVRKRVFDNACAKDWTSGFYAEINGYRFDLLTSDRELELEGQTQRHCVGSYKGRARAGRVFIFRVTGKERATLALYPPTPYSKRFRIQLHSFANGGVSPECSNASWECGRMFFRPQEEAAA